MFEKAKKYVTGAGFVFLLVLAGLLFWMFQQVRYNYQNMQLSNSLMDKLVEYQTSLTRVYEHRSKLLGQQLDQTKSLAEQYRTENEQLRQRIKLLDELGDLQATISLLQEENNLVKQQMEALRAETSLANVKIKSLKEGKTLIVKRQQQIKEIQKKIHEFKREMYQQHVADQDEVDRVESLLGNKGFMVLDGRTCSQSAAVPAAKQQVDVEVEFVP